MKNIEYLLKELEVCKQMAAESNIKIGKIRDIKINTRAKKRWGLCSYTSNGFIIEITSNSSKKIYWICEKGHHYSTSIANRVKGKSCLVCINKQVLKGYNDLLSQKPELAKEWDYELNTIKPDEIYYKNQRELIHWVCKTCGHKWTSKINQRKELKKIGKAFKIGLCKM